MSDRTVVVTRPAHQQEGLAALLSAAGFTPLPMPVLSIVPLPLGASEPEVYAGVDRGDYELVVFTSINAVRVFAERLVEFGYRIPETSAIAVQGAGSAGAVRERIGRTPEIVGGGNRAEELLRSLLASGPARRTLVTTPREGRGIVERGLIGAGYPTTVLPLYETVASIPPEPSMHTFARLDPSRTVVTFFSPSAVGAFLALGAEYSAFLSRTTIVTVGPVTTERVRSEGLVVAAEADRPSDEAVVECVVRLHESR
jgi:uroporphyrinogen III methyltransferase / synthase